MCVLAEVLALTMLHSLLYDVHVYSIFRNCCSLTKRRISVYSLGCFTSFTFWNQKPNWRAVGGQLIHKVLLRATRNVFHDGHSRWTQVSGHASTINLVRTLFVIKDPRRPPLNDFLLTSQCHYGLGFSCTHFIENDYVLQKQENRKCIRQARRVVAKAKHIKAWTQCQLSAVNEGHSPGSLI